MSLDLLNELEKRVQSAVSTIEGLKQEIEQLKEENAALTSEKDAWEGRLAGLLGKFDLISNGDVDVDSEEPQDDVAEGEDSAETLANQAFAQDFAEATAEEQEQASDTEDSNRF